MKILNLYAGIGGNRKLWGDEHEITAVENNEKIAQIYQDFFPGDKMVIEDAHKYLLDNFEKFDFIWSSPPCPTHSRPAYAGTYSKKGHFLYRPPYPDMKLYQEILLLQGFFRGKYVVENVIAWYDPLIKPRKVGDHYYWTNFNITQVEVEGRKHDGSIEELQIRKGFDLSKYSNIDKRVILRNCVEPEVGLHILNQALNIKQAVTNQEVLF